MHQGRSHMGEEREEEEPRQVAVCLAKPRKERRVRRQDRGKRQAAAHRYRIMARRQHAPTDQRHRDHQAVKQPVRTVGRELLPFRQIRRQRRRRMRESEAETDKCEHEDRDAQRPMDRQQPRVLSLDARHQARTDEQHGEDHDRHQPVHDPGERMEGACAHRCSSLAWAAPGRCPSSLVRRRYESAYAAERATMIGSFETSMPFGRIVGS